MTTFTNPRRWHRQPISGRRVPNRVYFAQCGEYIKIGVSSNPARRVERLRYERRTFKPATVPHGEPLRLLAAIPGDYGQEGDWHYRFREDWVGGEWFLASDDLLAAVDALRVGDDR